MRGIFKKYTIGFDNLTFFISNINMLPVGAISNVEEEIIINASNYNLDPTGEKDNSKALVNMFEELKEISKSGKHITLKFDKGIYQIHKENAPIREIHTSNTDSVRFPNKSIGILIENQNNLTIDANESQFIINGDMMALAIMQSENITIKNINIDYQIPTTSEMTVLDFDNTNKTIDYFIPEYLNYEIQGANIIWKSEQKSDGGYYWTEKNDHRNYGISVKYPTELMGRAYYSNSNPFTNAQSIEKLDNSRVRIKYSSAPAFEIVKGMNFQLLSNAERPTAGAFVWESKDVNVINAKISYMHGFGFLVQMAENVTFDGIRMETDIETGRNTSSFADGIHVSGAKGKIEIKNSFFNNTHDDPINIHGTFTRVEEKLPDNKLRLKYVHNQQGGFPQYYPGDKVVFYSRDKLESKDAEKEYTVKSVEGPSKGNLKEMIVEFEEKLPEYLTEKIGNEPKYVAENATYTPEIYIKNNEFKNVFTRMILATSRKKIVIEDNYFEAPSMASLFFSNDSDEWYESGPIRDLEIRNNTFKIRSLGRTWWKYAPAIYFHPVTKGGQFPDQSNPIHKNIMIEGNKFYLESDGALRAESVENLTFRDNEIYRLNPEVDLSIEGSNKLYVGNKSNLKLTYNGNTVTGLTSLPGGPESNSGTVANVLEFKNSKNVVVEDNYYDDGLRKNVLIEGMDSNNLNLKDNLNILTNREKTEPSEVVSNIQYASSNPEIVSVDGNGKITANKEGTAEVFAYYVWNNTIIESNKQEITVLNNDYSSNTKTGFYLNGKSIVDGDTLIIPEKLTKLELINFENQTKSVIDITNKDLVSGDFGTIKLKKIKSNISGIESIEAIGYGEVDLSDKNSFINTENKDKTITFNVKLSEGTDKLLVKNYDHEINYDVIKEGNNARVTVPVYNGVVSVAFEAIAQDGVTKDVHSVHIMRYANIIKGFNNINLNGNDMDISTNKIDLDNKTNVISINAKANDQNAEITIMKRNSKGIQEILHDTKAVVENGDEVIVRIIHENKRMMEFKTFTVENSKELDNNEEVDKTLLGAFIEYA